MTQTPLSSLDAEMHALQLRAAAALRAWRDAPPGEGVAEMREAANYMLDARAQFQTSDGSTDWSGRSSEYRQFHRGVINLAAKDSAEAKAMQDTLRWHVQHQRAKRLTREELQRIGLRPDTPNERATAREHEAARALSRTPPTPTRSSPPCHPPPPTSAAGDQASPEPGDD